MTIDPRDPERPADPGGVVVRRLSWRPVTPPLISLAIVVATLGLGTLRAWWPTVLAGLFFLLGAFLVLVTLRSRTELGPEAVRNRAVFRTRVIPWSSVVGVSGDERAPRTIRLELADGTRTVLAGIRERDRPVDGLGYPELLALVRARAGVPYPESTGTRTGAAADGDAAPDDLAGVVVPERLVLRPSRWPVVWLVPLAAVITAGLLTLHGTWVAFLWAYLVVAPALLVLAAVRLLRGRTEVDRTGIRNRLAGGVREVRWEAVRRVMLAPSLFGWRVKVVLSPNRQVVLAAPRTGLLARDPEFASTVRTLRAMALPHRPPVRTVNARGVRGVIVVLLALVVAGGLAAGQPWLEPWWPTRHEAATVPNACAVLDAAGAATMVPPPAQQTGDGPRDYTYFVTSTCYRDRDQGGELQLELRLDRRAVGQSGTAAARDDYAEQRRIGGAWTPLPGLGDEACRSVRGTHQPTVTVLVRRANVTIEVGYWGPADAATSTARAAAVARAALDRIRLR